MLKEDFSNYKRRRTRGQSWQHGAGDGGIIINESYLRKRKEKEGKDVGILWESVDVGPSETLEIPHRPIGGKQSEVCWWRVFFV